MFGMSKILQGLVLTFVALFWLPVAVWAHGLHVFGWVEGDTGHVESYFSQTKRAAHARVEVYDMNEQMLLAGTTDARGNFSFKLPLRADLRIVVSPGMGHKNDFVLRAEAMGRVAGREQVAEKVMNPQTSRAPVTVDPQQLEEMIREAVDHSLEHALEEKLAPLNKTVREMRRPQGVSVRDVIAGLGYIFGIFGLALFLFQRRGKKSDGKR